MSKASGEVPETPTGGMADGQVEEGSGCVLVSANVLLQHVADETVLLDLSSGTYFGLDPIGTRMLDLARAEGDLDTIVRMLEQEYDAPSERLRQDLELLLGELVEAGLIQRRADRAP